MNIPTTFEELVLWYGISLLSSSIATKPLNNYRTYITRTIIGYTVLRTTKARIMNTQAAKMRLFYEMGSSQLMFNRI